MGGLGRAQLAHRGGRGLINPDESPTKGVLGPGRLSVLRVGEVLLQESGGDRKVVGAAPLLHVAVHGAGSHGHHACHRRQEAVDEADEDGKEGKPGSTPEALGAWAVPAHDAAQVEEGQREEEDAGGVDAFVDGKHRRSHRHT